MRKVKLILATLAASAVLWTVGTRPEAPPALGVAKNHTRAVVVVEQQTAALAAAKATAE